MSNSFNEHLIDANEAAADVYEAMRAMEAHLSIRVMVPAARPTYNEQTDADMERMLREAGW